jgi:hypothetical protein
MNPRTTSIDHHPRVKDELCAPQMFTHGHTLQLASVLRAHLVGLVDSTGLLPGLAEEVFVDVDSLLRPVYGHETRRELRPHQDRRQAGPPQRLVTVGCHDLDPGRRASDRRDPAPRR